MSDTERTAPAGHPFPIHIGDELTVFWKGELVDGKLEGLGHPGVGITNKVGQVIHCPVASGNCIVRIAEIPKLGGIIRDIVIDNVMVHVDDHDALFNYANKETAFTIIDKRLDILNIMAWIGRADFAEDSQNGWMPAKLCIRLSNFDAATGTECPPVLYSPQEDKRKRKDRRDMQTMWNAIATRRKSK